MELPDINTVKTAGEAEDLAIEWQSWVSEEDHYMSEYVEWYAYFKALADKFDLTEEFTENGII